MNQPLRATRGLDSAGQKAINIGYPDKLQLNDGVNVDFFIYENTIQRYDATRTYPAGFAVIYNNRIYVSQVPITTPEPFQPARWVGTRVDPEWRVVTSTSALQGNLRQGEYVISQITAANAVFTMPYSVVDNVPATGDTIVLKDNGFATHEFEIIVNGNGKNINGKSTYRITRPGCTVLFIYTGTEWAAQIWDQGVSTKTFVSNSDYIQGENFYRAKVGDHLLRETQYGGGLRIRLPRYANHGDTVTTYDLDGLNPVTKTEILVYPGSNHKILPESGGTAVDSLNSSGSGWGVFIFDGRNDQWRIFDSDLTARWNMIQSNYTAILGEKLTVYTKLPTETVVVTFPSDAADGDSFVVDTSYMAKGSKITLQIGAGQTNDYIVPTANTLGIPRVTEYRATVSNIVNSKSKTETFVIDNRAMQWEFAYSKNALNTGFDTWILITSSPLPFKVDRSDTSFAAMAEIANQAEVNKNKEDIVTGQNRDCEAFVTPETLANKVGSTVNRGIVRFSNNAESKATTGNLADESWSGVAISPFLLNDRLATTSMRGVMTTTTQAQANAMSGSGENWDRTAITPSTLNGRKSTETQTGITYQVIQAGVKQAARGTKGTNVHDFDEHYRYVTPKVLFEKVATDTSQGMCFTATQTEVNAGTANDVNGPLVVTASTLNARQATLTLTGLSRAVTDAEMLSNTPVTGDNIHVTPDSVVKRTATESRWGFAETATQAEVDAGVLHDKWFITPKTNKAWLDTTRLTVIPASGLTTTGTIWQGQSFDIAPSTETQRGTLRIATQSEANVMVNPLDDVIITPKKLDARQATETLTGLIELATQAEVDAGTDAARAVTPKGALASNRSAANYRMTDSRYGVGQMATLANDGSTNATWQGNDTVGSTRALNSYAHTDIVVSPRGLNTALANYLPLRGTAVSSDAMDASGTRVPANDWVRRTVDQTITGNMTFAQNPVIAKSSGRLILRDTGTGHNNQVQYTTAASENAWSTGVVSLNGPFEIANYNNSTSVTRMTIQRTGEVTTTNHISNGGQDPNSANHLVRFGYAEDRYIRGPGNFAETVTGFKTFTHNTTLSAGANNAISFRMGHDTLKSGLYTGTDGTMAIGSTGTLLLRPRGWGDAAAQTSIDTTGILTATSQVRTMATAPVAANDLTRKDYVDNAIDDVTLSAGSRVNKQGDTMTGGLTIKAAQALTAEGNVSVTETLTVKNIRIAVGNGEFLEIRPNATTRSVEFVWIS